MAPNAFWFARSTVRIENRGPVDLPEFSIRAPFSLLLVFELL